MQAFVDAAAALDSAAEDPQAASAALDALSALLSSLDAGLASLASLQAALGTLHAAGTADGYVPQAVADLEALRGGALQVAAIAGALRAVQVRALPSGWQHL